MFDGSVEKDLYKVQDVQHFTLDFMIYAQITFPICFFCFYDDKSAKLGLIILNTCM